MTLVLFEDERVSQLYPVTVGRAACHLALGSYRLSDLAARLDPDVRLVTRPHLREVLDADGCRGALGGPVSARVALVNARLVPAVDVLERVRGLIEARRTGIVSRPEGVALALLPPDAPPVPLDAGPREIGAYLSLLQLPPLEADLPLVSYPHDLVRYHLAALGPNLAARLRGEGLQQRTDGVFLGAGATLGEYCVTDTRSGPIVIDAGASIGAHTYLRGPLYIGPGARVLEHAAIKDAVSLGPTTKVGGEVEGSAIEAYTNKQHHGFLGHSYLGSWINLGAGTCNSDLKNTYGQVSMEYFGQKVSTGMQFIGCIVGDYAKTAINTAIFTGKLVGACSMVYGFVTTNVPSFTNYARSFGQVTESPVEVMVATQARMFARRQVTQRPCDIQLLYDMYELTRHERQLAGEPLQL